MLLDIFRRYKKETLQSNGFTHFGSMLPPENIRKLMFFLCFWELYRNGASAKKGIYQLVAISCGSGVL